jgi:hypothetical protein|tara:strand:- start:266 stop:421 length:156 start_codon:yes stop_codon:yes gene_type:complete
VTLKEKVLRARIIEDLRHEMTTYQNAIEGGSKYTEYYQRKVNQLLEKMKAI